MRTAKLYSPAIVIFIWAILGVGDAVRMIALASVLGAVIIHAVEEFAQGGTRHRPRS